MAMYWQPFKALWWSSQVHKERNVVDHLPEQHKADVTRKMQNASTLADYSEAKRASERLHRELMDLDPRAARA
jgi:putative transposase